MKPNWGPKHWVGLGIGSLTLLFWVIMGVAVVMRMLWPGPAPKKYATRDGHTCAVLSVAYSPDGKTLASACADHTIKLWDVATGKERTILGGLTGESVAFSPDGKTLASASCGYSKQAGEIKLWDVATGAERATLKGHKDVVCSVAYSPDGKTLASGSVDKTIKLWDVATGKEQATLKGHTSGVYSVVFSPDGKTIASGSQDNRIRLLDVTTGKERAILGGLTGMSVAFSPDGKTLASASCSYTEQAGEIKLWDVATGAGQAALKVYTDPVSSVAFSPDGKTLASASRGISIIGEMIPGEIKLWDVATGKQQGPGSKEANSR